MNYFFLNKKEDFERGFSHNFVATDDILQTSSLESIFFSRVFDAQETEKQWHRMKFSITKCAYRVYIYACDEKPDILDVIYNENLSSNAKKVIMNKFLFKVSDNFNDIYLQDVKARYLWFAIEISNKNKQNIELSDIFIYFDGQNISKYLPEIYQNTGEDDFFNRFLMIFQSFYEDINDDIETESLIYNPMNTQYLEYLANFVGIEDIHMWEREKLRILIRNIKNLYKIRGTRDGLLQILSLFTDGGTYVFEDESDDEHEVKIFIKESNLKEQNTIRKIAQSVVPVGVYFNITVLKDYVLLGSSTYLGVNTRLISYDTIGLTGTSRLNYTVLGKE
ncbi:MAG: hypothetical protein R3Y09_08925 [Clostridia bacterium]